MPKSEYSTSSRHSSLVLVGDQTANNTNTEEEYILNRSHHSNVSQHSISHSNRSHSSSNINKHQEFNIDENDDQGTAVTLNNSKDGTINVERIVHKTLGPLGGFSIIAGIIIGSGIFISVKGSLAVFIPSIGALICLWVFGGLISLIGGLCYVQLGIMVPKSGGERTYLNEAFGPQFGIVFTYGYCFLVKTLALAGIGQTFGKYFFEMVFGNYKDPAMLSNIFAAIAILILCLINTFSKDLANKTQIVFTILKLLAIGGIIIIGIVFIAMGKGYKDPNPFSNPFTADTVMMSNLANCLINIFWAYEGWNSLSAIVGEMKNPKKDLPISVVFGTGVVIVVYSLTIVAYVGVLGYDNVMNTETVAASFASNTIPQVNWIIPLFICVSTFGACNGTILSISRIIMTGAVNREIPGVFGLVVDERRTPVIAIFSSGFISLILLLLPFDKLITYCALISWTFYGLTMAACIKLNWRHTNLDRSFKLPTFCPVIIILVSLYIVIMCFVNNVVESFVITTILLVVFGIHFLPERILKPAPVKKAHSKIKYLLTRHARLVMADQQDIS